MNDRLGDPSGAPLPSAAALDELRTQLVDPRHVRLFDLWRSKWKGGALPARADFDLPDLKFVLPSVGLFDVIAGGRYRHRLVGTEIARLLRFDPTGKFVDETPASQFRDFAIEAVAMVAATRLPYHRYRDIVADGLPRRYFTLYLPLASDGAQVDVVMTCTLAREASHP